jgi:hypothetical protein
VLKKGFKMDGRELNPWNPVRRQYHVTRTRDSQYFEYFLQSGKFLEFSKDFEKSRGENGGVGVSGKEVYSTAITPVKLYLEGLPCVSETDAALILC